jgi:hypothetical protein
MYRSMLDEPLLRASLAKLQEIARSVGIGAGWFCTDDICSLFFQKSPMAYFDGAALHRRAFWRCKPS